MMISFWGNAAQSGVTEATTTTKTKAPTEATEKKKTPEPTTTLTTPLTLKAPSPRKPDDPTKQMTVDFLFNQYLTQLQRVICYRRAKLTLLQSPPEGTVKHELAVLREFQGQLVDFYARELEARFETEIISPEAWLETGHRDMHPIRAHLDYLNRPHGPMADLARGVTNGVKDLPVPTLWPWFKAHFRTQRGLGWVAQWLPKTKRGKLEFARR